MGLVSKTFTLGCAALGLASASQLPEFSQQYRQRLNGALEELRVVVTDFDQDARKSGLTRAGALEQLLGSADPFPRDRGQSMSKTIDRFAVLEHQKKSMDQVEPVSRPIFMFQNPDEKIVLGAWQIFEPAVPLTMPGLVWGGFGALFLGLIARIPIALTGLFRRRRADNRLSENLNVQNAEIKSLQVTDEDLDMQGGSSNVIKPSSSLLNQIVLDEKMIGEVDAESIIRSKRNSDG